MDGLKQFFRIGFGPSSSHTIAPGLAMEGFLKRMESILISDDEISCRNDILEILGGMKATFCGVSFYDTGVGHKSPHALEYSLNEFFGNEIQWVIPDITSSDKEFSIPCFVESSPEPLLEMDVCFIRGYPEELSYETTESRKMCLHESVRNLSNGIIFEAFDTQEKTILAMAGYSVGGGQFCWVTYQEGENDFEHICTHPEFSQEYYKGPVYPEKYTSLKAIKDWCVANSTEEDEKSLHDFVEAFESPEDLEWVSDVVKKTIDESIRKGYDSVNIQNAYFDVAQKIRRRAYEIRREVEKLNPLKELLDQELEWSTSCVFPPAIAVMETNIMGAIEGGCKVCTAPTCGSCGLVPAVIDSCRELGLCENEESEVRALETAFIIGNLAKVNGSLSGAEAGCAAEIGVATAMAAAAMACIITDNKEMSFSDRVGIICGSAALGMRVATALTCDISIHGEVTIPCLERNSIYASQAMKVAEIMYFYDTLKDVDFPIGNIVVIKKLISGEAFDEAVSVMHLVGKGLPVAYRESSRGPTAKVLNPNYGERFIFPMKPMKSIFQNFLVGPGPSSSLTTSLYRGIVEVLRKEEADNGRKEKNLYQFHLKCPKYFPKKHLINARNVAVDKIGIGRDSIVEFIEIEYEDEDEFENMICVIDVFEKGKPITESLKTVTFECLCGGHYDIYGVESSEKYLVDVFEKHCTMQEIEEWCVAESKDISSYVIDHETVFDHLRTSDDVVHDLERTWGWMMDSIRNGLEKLGINNPEKQLAGYGRRELLSLYAMAVVTENAEGGLVVTNPFGNLGCGIIPSVIASAVETVVGMKIFEIDEIMSKSSKSEVSTMNQDRTMRQVAEARHLIVRGLAVCGIVGNVLKIADIESCGLSDLALHGAQAAAAAAHIMKCNSIKSISQAAEIVIEHSLGLVAAGHGRQRPVDLEFDIFSSLAVENIVMAHKAIDGARYSHLTTQYSEVSLEQILWVFDQTNRDINDALKNIERNDLLGMTTQDFFDKKWESGSMDILVDFWWK